MDRQKKAWSELHTWTAAWPQSRVLGISDSRGEIISQPRDPSRITVRIKDYSDLSTLETLIRMISENKADSQLFILSFQ